ncbi:MAG: polyprenyl synthetase family protein, partial [Synergistetes bacterium]|nr:polyprenyl synthetase family protein [Synergistota bacterium]
DFLPFACAIEMVHSFSLVHDDLPSMDNDYLRRGKPALHKYLNEAKALLVGDALLIMAFEMAMSLGLYGKVNTDAVVRASKELARALGAAGTTGGQFLDIDVSNDGTGNALLLKWIHERKTAALIRVSTTSAAIFLDKYEYLDSLAKYGESLGMLFQMVDDIMDVGTGEKANYAELVGIKEALQRTKELKQMADRELLFLGDRAEILRYLVSYIFKRGERFVSLRGYKVTQ